MDPLPTGSLSWRQRLRDFVALTKPRIVLLLLVTTLVPMIVAARGWPGTRLVLATLIAGYLMAGSANAMNMAIDADIDRYMGRTALRPIPAGRMRRRTAVRFSLMAGAVATAIFLWLVHPLAALLAVAGWVYYVGLYTLGLKRRSPHNIVIGGGAGAFPPLVGWAAVTGTVSLTALYLFLIVFFWTPPHFWALALVKEGDYGRVGVPMAPNVWGPEETARQMLVYTAVLVVLTLLPVAWGAFGALYLAAAVALGGWLLRGVWRLRRAPRAAPMAWGVYRASLLYLGLLFLAMAVDGLVRPTGPVLRGPDLPLPPGL